MWQFKRSLDGLDGKEDSSRMSLAVDPGTTPECHSKLLHKAASKGDLAGAKRALAAGAAVDSTGPDGQSALVIAAGKRHAVVLEYLLAKGAAVDLKSSDGKTALHICAAQGAVSSVEALLANGAEIDCKDTSFLGQTALHYAAANGKAAVVQLLLEKGATIDLGCFLGTALQLAAQNNHTAAVTLLLQKNAAMDRQDKQGRTALHMAADAGLGGVVDALVKAGCNVSLKDAQGKTALQLAKMKQTDLRSRPFGSQFAAFTSIVNKLQQIRVPAHEAAEVMRASLDIKRSANNHQPSPSHLGGLAGGSRTGTPSAAPPATPSSHSATMQPALASSLYQLTVSPSTNAASAASPSSQTSCAAPGKSQAESAQTAVPAATDAAQSSSAAVANRAVQPDEAAAKGSSPTSPAGQTVLEQVNRRSNSSGQALPEQGKVSDDKSSHKGPAQAHAEGAHGRLLNDTQRPEQANAGQLPQQAAVDASTRLTAAALTEAKPVKLAISGKPDIGQGDDHDLQDKGNTPRAAAPHSDSQKGSLNTPSAAPLAAADGGLDISHDSSAAVADVAVGQRGDDDVGGMHAVEPSRTLRHMSSSQQSVAAAKAFGLPDMTRATFVPVDSSMQHKAPAVGVVPNAPGSSGRVTAPAALMAAPNSNRDQAQHAQHALVLPEAALSSRRASASALMGASPGSKQASGQSVRWVGSPDGCVKPSGFFAGQMAAQQPWAIAASHSTSVSSSGVASEQGSPTRQSREYLRAQLAKIQEHQAHIEQQLDGVKSHLQELEQQEYFTDLD